MPVGGARPGWRSWPPVAVVFLVMAASWLGYNLSWRLDRGLLHPFLGGVFGTLLFLSVAFGVLVVVPWARARVASPVERAVAAWINPFFWATKECARLSLSFHPLECLYYYLNPLNLWLACGVAAEIALCEWVGSMGRRGGGAGARGGFALGAGPLLRGPRAGGGALWLGGEVRRFTLCFSGDTGPFSWLESALPCLLDEGGGGPWCTGEPGWRRAGTTEGKDGRRPLGA